MTAIVENAFYSSVIQFFLIFVIAPAGIIFVGSLIYIVVGIIKEMQKGRKRSRKKSYPSNTEKD